MMDDIFVTTDLGLASLLYAYGVKYHGLRLKEGTWQKEMAFDRPDPALIAGWQSGDIGVNALAFWRASRTLKHELMAQRDDRN